MNRWFCAQLGAREHYAIPRALHSRNMLERLFTEYWAGPKTSFLSFHLPSKNLRALASKTHQDIPGNRVKSWPVNAMLWEARLRLMTRVGGTTERYLAYCDIGKRFASLVSMQFEKMKVKPVKGIYFGFDTCSLEVMHTLKNLGIKRVLDQIDPCKVEIDMVKDEIKLWPGWQIDGLNVPDEFFERHHQEWELADRIVVNSNFSREALISQGVNQEKICVIPLSYEQLGNGPQPNSFTDDRNSDLSCSATDWSRKKPLRVLFLGQVMLRKGIQYLVEAGKLLKNEPVQFDVVGPIHISDVAVRSAPSNVQFHGRVTRDQVDGWYQKTHVFILPTLSDGFAITQIEAMANGLPVIATRNCGDVITDGVDGTIIQPRSPDSIVKAIHSYLNDPALLYSQKSAAIRKSREFSLAHLGSKLQKLETQLVCE